MSTCTFHRRCEKKPEVSGIFTSSARARLALGFSIVDNREMERTLLFFSRARVRHEREDV